MDEQFPDITLDEGLDILSEMGMNVVDMREEVIEVTCIACLKPIVTPAECNMDSFRLGMPTHHECLNIHERIERAYDRIKG